MGLSFRKFVPIFLFLFVPQASSRLCFSLPADRTIAILEQERLLETEEGLKLSRYFHSQNPAIRIQAVLAAARIGNRAILPDLVPLAADRESDVRKAVAFALGQIRSKQGFDAVTKMLKDSDSEVRRLAIESLGRIGGMEATPYLIPLLDEKDLPVREQAALSLALIKDKAAVDKLIEKVATPDPAQWSYVYALYRIADPQSIPALHEVLKFPSESPSTGDPSSILFALKALWNLKKPLTMEETAKLLHDPDQRIRQNALDVLAVSADKTFCVEIDRSYGDMNVLTRAKALETKGSLGCTIDWVEDETPAIMGARLFATATSTKEAALPLLRKYMTNESWVVRWRIAQGLGNISEDSSIPLLKVLMEDQDSAVRLAALDSLAKFLPKTAEIFLPLLKHQDFAVRATAADTLGKTKDRKYLPALLEAYRASSEATEIEGRVAVLDVLSEFGSSEVLETYLKAFKDPEYTVRKHAIDGLQKLVGSEFVLEGKIRKPEEFVFENRALSKKTVDDYPRDFEAVIPDFMADIILEKGTVRIRLLGSEAPEHVLNFRHFVENGFYKGLRIHRVVPNFVIQGGDPRGDGWGGGSKIVHDHINMKTFRRGVVGMPTAGKDTGGCQFFITHSRQPHLDGNYTIFGEVISGMEVVDVTEVGDRILDVRIVPQ